VPAVQPCRNVLTPCLQDGIFIQRNCAPQLLVTGWWINRRWHEPLLLLLWVLAVAITAAVAGAVSIAIAIKGLCCCDWRGGD
jgi:hypothetical protein